MGRLHDTTRSTLHISVAGLHVSLPYPTRLEHVQLDVPEGGDVDESAYGVKGLLPFMKRLPAKRVVHLPRDAAGTLRFRLLHDLEHPLPPGVDDAEFAVFDVSGAGSLQARRRAMHFCMRLDCASQETIDNLPCGADDP